MSEIFDVRIFGVPERMDMILKTQAALGVPDENIVIDYDHIGCAPTAKRTWLKQTDKPYTIVLADDAEPCSGFLSYCERAVKAHPKYIFSLFPFQFIRPVPGSRLPVKSPYVLTNKLSGCGIIMRTEWVLPCVESWRPGANGDDVCIQAWAKRQRIQILTTLPALIQHIGDVSVFDSSRVLGRTPYFDPDPVNVNWDSKYITPYNNILEE